MRSEQVGCDHPGPAWRPDQQERDRQAEEPARQEHRPAPAAAGERAGQEVGERLGDPEGDDERQRGGEGGEPEPTLAEQREHSALLSDHAADQRVDADQQRELGKVGAQAEAHRWTVRMHPSILFE